VSETLPTVRSEFSFQQFEERLQNYAYKLACDVISDPEQHGRIRIIMNGRRLQEIETAEFTIRFYAKHASFQRNKKMHRHDYDYTVAECGFDVEDKEYTTSNHRSKISYYGSDMTKPKPGTYEYETDEKRAAEIKQAVLDFIDKLMAGVQIEPRFTLKRAIGDQERHA